MLQSQKFVSEKSFHLFQLINHAISDVLMLLLMLQMLLKSIWVLFLTYLIGISRHDRCCWFLLRSAAVFAVMPAKSKSPLCLCCATLTRLLLVPLGTEVQPPFRSQDVLFLCFFLFPSRALSILRYSLDFSYFSSLWLEWGDRKPLACYIKVDKGLLSNGGAKVISFFFNFLRFYSMFCFD